MRVKEHEQGDAERLEEMIRTERNAKQRDRYRMVVWSLRGRQKQEIADGLGVAMSTVELWVYRYRDGGLGALRPRRSPGRRCRLTPEQREQLRQRLDEGPRPEDGVCTLRGEDVRRIIAEQFGVEYSLQGAYDLLHRLGYSCLVPRPRHEKNGPRVMEQFKASAPLLCGV